MTAFSTGQTDVPCNGAHPEHGTRGHGAVMFTHGSWSVVQRACAQLQHTVRRFSNVFLRQPVYEVSLGKRVTLCA